MAPWRRRYRYDPTRLRVYILVRDLHSPLSGLVLAFQQQGIPPERITLVDTGSTAMDCLSELRRLEGQGCRYWQVPVSEQRYGPYVVWLSAQIRRELQQQSYPYLVTDADLQFPPRLPTNWLPRLFATLNSHRFALKTSLPLRTGDLTVPQRAQIRAHERALFRHPAYRLLSLLLLRRHAGQAVCTTDTTLSLYRPARCFSTLSVRLSARYGLRHLPWYASFAETEEFRYYTTHKLSLFGEWSSLSTDG